MYPDEFQGYYNYALTSWYHSYELAEAIGSFAGTGPAQPRRRSAFYLQGVLLLCQERYAESLASFQQYESLADRASTRSTPRRSPRNDDLPKRRKSFDSHAKFKVANIDFASRIDSVIFPSIRAGGAGMSVMDELMLAAGKVIRRPSTARG